MNSQEIKIAVLTKVLSEQVSIRIQMEVEANLARDEANILRTELDALKAKYEKPADPPADPATR